MKKLISLALTALFILTLPSCGLIKVIPNFSITLDFSSETDETAEPTSKATEPTAEPTSEPTSEPTEEPTPTESRVSFVAVGDNIVHDSVREDAERLSGISGVYDFTPMYSNIASVVRSADLAFVNMECPVAGASFGYSGYPMFNAPESAVDALVRTGFDVFNINNNHMLDMGTAGLSSTMNYFRSRGDVMSIGAYFGEDELYAPHTVTVNGIRIGFVSLGYGSNIETIDSSYGITVPFYLTKNADGTYSVNTALVKRIVSTAAETCDFLIASVHWGTENSFTVTDEQKTVARLIAESGADVIIGHHPHVIQSVEWLTNDDSSRTLVVYSLGNFISTQYYDYNMLGGMMTFDIVKSESGAHIENAIFRPTMTHYSMNRDSLKLYFLEDYSETLAKSHGTTLHSDGFSYEKMISYVKYIIPSEFLADFHK